jgi:hypothetical protein
VIPRVLIRYSPILQFKCEGILLLILSGEGRSAVSSMDLDLEQLLCCEISILQDAKKP